MEARGIVAAGIVAVLLLSAILYKIIIDRKRRLISLAENNNASFTYKKAQHPKMPNLWGIPAWGLALLTLFLSFPVLMFVGDILVAVFNIPESNAADLIFYLLFNLIIATGCFFICRLDPGSIWYVPVLCNLTGIVSSIIEPTFWISYLWIVICSGWVLSIIASLTGFLVGRKKTVSPYSQEG